MLLLIISALLLSFLISTYKVFKGYSILRATPAYVPKSKFKIPKKPKQELGGIPAYYY